MPRRGEVSQNAAVAGRRNTGATGRRTVHSSETAAPSYPRNHYPVQKLLLSGEVARHVEFNRTPAKAAGFAHKRGAVAGKQDTGVINVNEPPPSFDKRDHIRSPRTLAPRKRLSQGVAVHRSSVNTVSAMPAATPLRAKNARRLTVRVTRRGVGGGYFSWLGKLTARFGFPPHQPNPCFRKIMPAWSGQFCRCCSEKTSGFFNLL